MVQAAKSTQAGDRVDLGFLLENLDRYRLIPEGARDALTRILADMIHHKLDPAGVIVAWELALTDYLAAPDRFGPAIGDHDLELSFIETATGPGQC